MEQKKDLLHSKQSCDSVEVTPKPSKRYIDKDMILVKLVYLFWGGLVATYTVYLNPFYVSIGIPKSKAGTITGVPYAVSSVAAPLWGMLTDYTGRQRLILVVLCLCSAIWVFSLPLIAIAVADGESVIVNTTILSNNMTSYTAFDKVFLSCNSTCNNSERITKSFKNLHNPVANGNKMFYTFLGLMAMGSIFFSCVAGYIDAIALKAIKVSPSGATYGSQRVFGSIGACVVTYLTGVLLDHVPITGLSPFAILFFSYPVFPLLLIPMVLLMIRQERMRTKERAANCETNHSSPTEIKRKEKGKEISIRKQLMTSFCQIEIVMLMITAFIAGLSFGMIFFKMFLINEQMNVSKTKISLAFSVGSFSNIVMFPFTSRFIRLLHGPIPTIIFGLFCYCIRYVLMSYTKSYILMVALQGFSAFTFASMWSSFMEHIHEISPNKIKTTMIVSVQSIHFGLGAFLCNTVGGVLYGMYDAKTLFRWNGVMCGIWACVMIAYYGIRVKKRRSEDTMVPLSLKELTHEDQQQV